MQISKDLVARMLKTFNKKKILKTFLREALVQKKMPFSNKNLLKLFNLIGGEQSLNVVYFLDAQITVFTSETLQSNPSESENGEFQFQRFLFKVSEFFEEE